MHDNSDEMVVKYTEDQQRVIDIRDCNVLVSAAAGSGKTAVLVERILGLITDPERPVDIDRLLVVTFTNAAAAQMRERICDAIADRLGRDPNNANLQRQAVLVHHARITTIDSFCRFLLNNHFQEIDLDPGFVTGDPGKMRLMEKEAMAAVLEEAYAGAEYYEGFHRDFIRLADVFSIKGRDTALEEMTDKIYHFVMSLPFPKKWLKEALKDYEAQDSEQPGGCGYIRELMAEASQKLAGMERVYDGMLKLCGQEDGPEAYLPLLQKEREQLAICAQQQDYASLREAVTALTFDRLPPVHGGGCDEEKKERVKCLRDRMKKRIAALKELCFFEAPEDMKRDMETAGELLKPLLYVTLAFMERFAKDKERENVIDFSDMEHFALQILADEDGNPTDTAKQYQEYYAQIMIDEYQDSNEIQELLLSVISRENAEQPNRFMVGDMKQSIYKFRMARPEIFLDKYVRYGAGAGRQIRIDLKKNFRSRREIIDTVNTVFYPLMDKQVGGIRYNADTALYAGADYPEYEPDGSEGAGAYDAKTELLIYEKTGEDGEKSAADAKEAEAWMIAGKIRWLLQNGRVTDAQSGALRPVHYDDIVILVRSTTGLLEELQEVLKKEGIPASIPSRTGYFSATEVQTLLQVLEVLVNPGHDIALAAVLKSPLYGFTDEELSQIAMICLPEGTSASFYEKVKRTETEKARRFLKELEICRKAAKTETVHDLLYRIIREHRYLEYVAALPGGGVRRANVEMLLEKAVDYEKLQMHGLFGFLQYMKQLEKYEVDYGEGTEENSDCVRLMTIHKSKGLEFPICFVAGLSKRFNRRDVSGALLLHTDLGIGMEYRDVKKRVRRKTIKQKLIAERMRSEELGEELRVFYVALTRAKEKLILTGVSDDFAKELEECRILNAGQYELPAEERRVEPELILESGSFLKLLLHVLSLYQDAPERLPRVRLYHEAELKKSRGKEQIKRSMKKEALLRLLEAKIGSVGGTADTGSAGGAANTTTLRERIFFPYPHPELAGLYTKTSVSELKLAALHEDEQTDVLFETEREETVIPMFMRGEQQAGGAARGTAYHRLMELLDFKLFADCRAENEITVRLNEQIKTILQSKRMREEELALIDQSKVRTFLQSELAREMQEADREGKLYREQPFVLSIAASRIGRDFPEDERMLIQGIIDAYYEKAGAIYLMDYKTDRIARREELVKRYRLQLDYYKEALERLTGKEVKGVFLYSYHFLESLAI